jgi:Fic family protein
MSKTDFSEKYPYLHFQRNWQLSEATHQALGQCTALIQTIADLPLLPAAHKKLYRLSQIKGAQATTAIEGNSLTFDQVQQIVEGKSLNLPSKEYQEKEVRSNYSGSGQADICQCLKNAPGGLPVFLGGVHD